MDGDTTTPEPGGSKRGRKTKLTQEVALGIALLIEQGNYRTIAAKRFGIAKNTLINYMKLGRQFPEGIYGVFRNLVIEAEAELERKCIASIMAAGADDPDHLKWVMERRFPERWGRHVGEFARIRKQIKDLERELVKRELQEAGQTS